MTKLPEDKNAIFAILGRGTSYTCNPKSGDNRHTKNTHAYHNM
jgi:hypothetical protein